MNAMNEDAEVGGRPPQASRILSQRLKQWRHERGVPLRVLSKKLSVSISTVSSWENGTRFPSASHLDALAGCVNMPICNLLYHEEGSCPHCASGCVQ